MNTPTSPTSMMQTFVINLALGFGFLFLAGLALLVLVLVPALALITTIRAAGDKREAEDLAPTYLQDEEGEIWPVESTSPVAAHESFYSALRDAP